MNNKHFTAFWLAPNICIFSIDIILSMYVVALTLRRVILSMTTNQVVFVCLWCEQRSNSYATVHRSVN